MHLQKYLEKHLSSECKYTHFLRLMCFLNVDDIEGTSHLSFTPIYVLQTSTVKKRGTERALAKGSELEAFYLLVL